MPGCLTAADKASREGCFPPFRLAGYRQGRNSTLCWILIGHWVAMQKKTNQNSPPFLTSETLPAFPSCSSRGSFCIAPSHTGYAAQSKSHFVTLRWTFSHLMKQITHLRESTKPWGYVGKSGRKLMAVWKCTTGPELTCVHVLHALNISDPISDKCA